MNIGTGPVRWRDVVGIALRWPEVAEAVSYGAPSLKVRGRLLARHRPDDDSIVLLDVPHAERAHLMETWPEAFFCEPHYRDHDIVLARLPHAPPGILERLLERRWRSSATRRAIAAFDG